VSLEITLYTKTATKQKLIKLLRENKYEKVNHIIESMNDENNLHYMWYGTENYESFVGVEVTLVRVSKSHQKEFNCSEWILHTRTRSSGSRIDKKRQNELVREARRLFGGSFYNDWYGTNRYTNLDEYENLSASERGLFLMYENLSDKLKGIRHCIENYENPISNTLTNLGSDAHSEILKMQDPSIVLYNSVVPFSVSLIEYFFSQTFKIMIKYDQKSQKLIEEENIKIPLKDAISIKNGDMSIEDIISRNINFQNLQQVNKAFNKYLDIDIYKILSKRKKIDKSIVRLKDKVEEIILSRHLVIHQFSFDYSITKKEVIVMLLAIEISVREVIEKIENVKDWKIRL